MLSWAVWPECSYAKWVYVDGIYLVNPFYLDEFRRRHSVINDEGKIA